MRKGFVYFAVVPAIVLCLVVYLFADSWIEVGLEYAGTKSVGAKVEIDGLKLTLSPIGIQFARLQVTDPQDGWKNLVETGNVHFALNFGQLLRGKYIVETMEVNNAIVGTKRSTDGSIPKPPPEPTPEPTTAQPSSEDKAMTALEQQNNLPPLAEQSQARQEEQKSSAPSFDLASIKKNLNLDSLSNPNNLASTRYLDSMKQQINTASANWDKTYADLDQAKPKYAEIENAVKSINVGESKSADAAKSALDKLNTSYKSGSDLVNNFAEQKKTLTGQLGSLSSGMSKIDDVAKQDFQNVVTLAKLPDVNLKGIAEMLLGNSVFAPVNKYLFYVDEARTKIRNATDKPPKEKTDRFRGQNIHFASERGYPKIWIKKILLSGGTDRAQDSEYIYAKGEILNVSTDQRITGLPITAEISAEQGRGTSYAFNALIDRRKAESFDQYKVTAKGIPVGAMEMGSSSFVPSKITSARLGAVVQIDVPGSGFEASAGSQFSEVKMEFASEPRNVVERIVHDVLRSVNAFRLDLKLWRNERKLDVAFKTDLDDIISSRAKKVVGDEIAKIQNDIRNKVNAQIAAKRAEVEKLFNAKKQELQEKLKAYEAMANEKLAQVDGKKKEIEKKIEDEKNRQADEAKKKLEEGVKGLFKR
jgi:uncharacterized protein (TIGR03545 family)